MIKFTVDALEHLDKNHTVYISSVKTPVYNTRRWLPYNFFVFFSLHMLERHLTGKRTLDLVDIPHSLGDIPEMFDSPYLFFRHSLRFWWVGSMMYSQRSGRQCPHQITKGIFKIWLLGRSMRSASGQTAMRPDLISHFYFHSQTVEASFYVLNTQHRSARFSSFLGIHQHQPHDSFFAYALWTTTTNCVSLFSLLLACTKTCHFLC